MTKVENLTKVLEQGHKSGYAVGSFSPRYTKLILPIIKAAIDTVSPVIIQISEKEVYRHKVAIKDFAEEFFRVVEELQPCVPVVLHLDHTKDFEIIKQAIAAGFTSVMIDASEHEFNKNVELSKQTVDYAHPYGVTVEAELGRIGTTDFVETDHDEEFFTVPEEAKEFCERTRVDALAVSVGTAHGSYTVRQPRIDYERLEHINRLVDTPLVLHGGSGVPSEMVIKAVRMTSGGVSKVNIATDVEQSMLHVLGKETHMTEEELNGYSGEMLEKARQAVYELVKEKINDYLLSAGKAI
ncbi:fructose-bisphosphate aldolase class II [Anaerotaenia torta]|uniref:class II fructose-bisphosphate aldolase n=1 Tax=Anaerotaenia torta TaxID=433293 RepID=UPI003D1A7C0A